MNFNYTNKLLFILSTFILLSCQDSLQSNKILDDSYEQSIIEINEILDLNFIENSEINNIYDYYSKQLIKYDFTKKKLDRIKIKNFLDNINELIPLNLIYDNINLYSLNSKGNILKINKNTGNIIEEITLSIDNPDYINPISFSLINNDFIIGFKSGHIIRCNKNGKVIWAFKKDNLLNSPLKITNDYIIILYPEDIVLLSNDKGKILFEKNYRESNVIQSSGGKLASYFNFLYFILPNSSFGSIDTFFFDVHFSEINSLQFKNSLNNLDDNLHNYKNYLVYLDNGNQLNTFDIIKNEFILKNFTLNNIKSYAFYNNALVVIKNNIIELYNIKNGKVFFSINIDNNLKKVSRIIEISSINNKLHIFFENGKILIIDNKEIQHVIDLKIKKINNIYSINNLLLVSTRKGITYIY